MNFVLKNKWLVIIFVLAAFLRFYKLSEFPIHLGHDEVSQLYDAISIADTGKDIYGNPFPFVFKSVNDYKAPFYIYATSVAYRIFGWQDFTARVVGALFGTLVVLGIYIFVKLLLKIEAIALISAVLTAISPFEVFFSRKSFENQSGIFMMLVGFIFLLYHYQKKKINFFYLGSLVLGIATYVYYAQAVIVPILLFTFLIIFRSKFKRLDFKPILLFVLVVAPLCYMIFFNPDTQNRSKNVFITQDSKLNQMLVDKSGFDKIWITSSYALSRYFSQFNPRYLFFDGLDMTEGKRDVGPLFPVLIPFLIFGFFSLATKKEARKEKLFILIWILIGMLPSGLTFEDKSPHRSIMAFTMLNVISGAGIHWFGTRFGKFAYLGVFLLLTLNLGFFAKRYIINYPIERSEALHYPYKDIALYARENHDKYDLIVFDPKFGEFAPWIGTGAHYYLAFYGKYPPEMMQKEYGIGDQKVRETKFDKLSIRAVFWPDDHSLKNTLIIASPWSLPPDIKKSANIVKTFYFRTTAEAFYAIKL